ncbi:MAG: sulfite exporter TauE/SafE family protein [Deltaproteobacteria bacterium]|nr:sulfite exporter TauE/SafE family protein [Deltaproteobacteria bacterium]MBW2503504.1 sulfite exporter TauE/SafE family protein [Deltaproteobacteria bacterium]MBW2519460.1 sulfite exporter TauE/SafE family protein [Deltaproteobacteria bacterium]
MNPGSEITIWIAFTAGILSFFSPCVLPLIPSYLTYITGLSFGQLQESHPGAKVRLTVLLHSLCFILGFSIVFVLLGAIAGVASAKFQQHLREGLVWVERIGGLLIFLFGLHMTGLFHFGVLLGEKRVHLHQKPSGYFGTIVVGIAFAAGWTPCIGPILASILMIAASSGQAAKGVWLLSFYSIGLGLPFLVSGLLFHQFLSAFNRFRKHIRMIEIITGTLLMLVGIILMFNLLGRLTMYLYQWMPPL